MDFNVSRILELLTSELNSWLVAAVKALPNLIVALIVFFLFLFTAKMVRNVGQKIFARFTDNVTVSSLLISVSSTMVILLGLFVSLGILKLDKTLTSLLAGAGVIGLALGFAFQEIASNFVSGVFIAFRKPYKVNDIVKIDDYFGKVESISLRTTSLKTFDGLEVILPNKKMFTEPFINFTSTPERRVDIEVGVSYGDNLRKVVELLKSKLRHVNSHQIDPNVEVLFKEFGSSSINLEVRFWVHCFDHYSFLESKHEAIILIKEAFDENSITIPFPIRTLDFGIKGGVALNESIKPLMRN